MMIKCNYDHIMLLISWITLKCRLWTLVVLSTCTKIELVWDI